MLSTGGNPPLKVVEGYFSRIWKAYDIDKIILVKKGVFLLRFTSLQDKLAVEKGGIFFFDSNPLVVKGWNPEMDLRAEAIKSLPI